MQPSETVQAERHIKFRILAATLIAFGLLANYYTTYSLVPVSFGDYSHLLSGPFFALILILFLANGQEHFWSSAPTVQRLLGDESTVDNRRRAQAFGFWAMILCGIAVAAVSLFWFPMPGHKAAQLVVTLALAAAALRFAILEQHALNP
jgi:uncharacterized membrane protein HdeD (DUF308 family)